MAYSVILPLKLRNPYTTETNMNWVLFNPNGPRRLPNSPTALPNGDSFLWLDTPLESDALFLEAIQALGLPKLHELHVEDLAYWQHPSHFDTGDGYHRLIIRSLLDAPLLDESQRLHIKTRPCFFLIFPQILITVRSQHSRTFIQAQHNLIQLNHSEHTPPQQFLGFANWPSQTTELASQLASNLTDRYLDLRAELPERIDNWQSDLLNPNKRFNNWAALLAARSELIQLEALAEDHSNALSDWLNQLKTKPEHQRSGVNLSDAIEHLHRVKRLASRLANTTEAAVQLHFSATTHKANEIMTTLTRISAIFMPLTLITGLFGMNFESMPWLHASWGFWACLGLMGMSCAISMLLMYRHQKLAHTSSQKIGLQWFRKTKNHSSAGAAKLTKPSNGRTFNKV